MERIRLIALILIGLTLPATAQHVEYRYDAAGNRILKQIVLNRTQARKRMATTSDKVANVEFTLCTNPTTGLLRIEATNLKDDCHGQTTIYTTNGGLIMRKPLKGRVTTINMSTLPQAVYILKIEINGQQSSWRIVKQ